MRHKFEVKNPIGNFSQLTLQKLSTKNHHRNMLNLNNRFEVTQANLGKKINEFQ